MIKDLLPVGSVIKLKGEDKRLMIFGILQKLSDDDTIYDYLGVPYPEGFIGTDFQFVFNSSDIEEVVFTGFESEERDYFLNMLMKTYDPENAIADLPDAPLKEEVESDGNIDFDGPLF